MAVVDQVTIPFILTCAVVAVLCVRYLSFAACCTVLAAVSLAARHTDTDTHTETQPQVYCAMDPGHEPQSSFSTYVENSEKQGEPSVVLSAT